MKAQLLIRGQARYAHTAESALVERLWRIVELSAAEISLAAVPGRIENHRMNVDPTAALSDQLNTNRSPVSLKAIAPALQSAQRHRLVVGVQRQVEITVQTRLPTNQSVNTPTAGDPNRAAGLGQVCQKLMSQAGIRPSSIPRLPTVGSRKPRLIARSHRFSVSGAAGLCSLSSRTSEVTADSQVPCDGIRVPGC
jgi:hypothetical protein